MSEDLQYPTRSYPYRARLDRAGPDPSRDLDVSFGESVETPDVPGLKARLVGVDPYAGRDISPGELERLDDPLARLLLKRGTFPRTLQQLLDALNAFNGDPGGVPHQNVFFISEWGQIPLNSTTARYPRQIRYILTRGRNEIGAADILVSTAPPSDDAGIFLQVAAWDRTNEVFHFYERGLRTSTWFWAGSSWDALAPPTRGKGPFDSHVNGAPVMKERKNPGCTGTASRKIYRARTFRPAIRSTARARTLSSISARVLICCRHRSSSRQCGAGPTRGCAGCSARPASPIPAR
jgi:hypothetical protein